MLRNHGDEAGGATSEWSPCHWQELWSKEPGGCRWALTQLCKAGDKTPVPALQMEHISLPYFCSAWHRFLAKPWTSFHLCFMTSCPTGSARAGMLPFWWRARGKNGGTQPPHPHPHQPSIINKTTGMLEPLLPAQFYSPSSPGIVFVCKCWLWSPPRKTPAETETLFACNREQSMGPHVGPLELLWRMLGNILFVFSILIPGLCPGKWGSVRTEKTSDSF